MKKPESVRCANCLFMGPAKTEGKFICKFNPPEPGGGTVGWVVVDKDWWCGRFRPKDNLTAVEWVAWMKGLDADIASK